MESFRRTRRDSFDGLVVVTPPAHCEEAAVRLPAPLPSPTFPPPFPLLCRRTRRSTILPQDPRRGVAASGRQQPPAFGVVGSTACLILPPPPLLGAGEGPTCSRQWSGLSCSPSKKSSRLVRELRSKAAREACAGTATGSSVLERTVGFLHSECSLFFLDRPFPSESRFSRDFPLSPGSVSRVAEYHAGRQAEKRQNQAR